MIDSHVHFWRYQASAFPWINADMAVLQHDFLPADYFAASGEQVTGMVAVQARTSWAENQFLLDLAQAEPRVQAVVGWFDFDGDVHTQLEWAQSMPLLKGFRHLIQDEAHPSAYLDAHTGLNQALPHLQAASYCLNPIPTSWLLAHAIPCLCCVLPRILTQVQPVFYPPSHHRLMTTPSQPVLFSASICRKPSRQRARFARYCT